MRLARNTCEIVVGRLLEFDVAAGYRKVRDVDEMITSMKQWFAKVPAAKKVVIVADWSACELLTPDVSARAVEMLTASNPRLERSAILHRSNQATSVLQVFRLIQEAAEPSRRVFTSPTELTAYLDEVLNEEERARLRTFLAGR